jgi:hypothetical protein
MKKHIVLLLFLAIVPFAFVNAQSWGSWNSIDCFKGIQFRVKAKKTSTGKYEAYVEFKNLYNKDIHFTYEATGGKYSTKNNRVTVRSDDTKESYLGSSFTSDYFYVNVAKLRFDKDGLQPYARCDK